MRMIGENAQPIASTSMLRRFGAMPQRDPIPDNSAKSRAIGGFRGQIRLYRGPSESLDCRRIFLLSRHVIVDCTVKADQRGSRNSRLGEKKTAFHSEHLHLG